jgi:NADH-quinone oxidoreductase subunit A
MNFYYYNEYYELLFYFFLSFFFSSLLLVICFIICIKNPYTEKNFSYECGFDPFSDSRNRFNIKFYLVSIIFIIFDVEVAFFFPWCICLRDLMFFSYFVMYFFIFILIVGFFYEWKKGVLDWE